MINRETKVGIFVLFGLVLTIVTIVLLGSSEDMFTRKQYFTAHFDAVDGLIEGAKVSLNGIKVGTVKTVAFDEEKKNIVIRFGVKLANLPLIREDATVEIATQGVLGDKYISINGGTADKPQLKTDSDIPRRQGQDIAGFLSKSDQLLVTLNSMASSMDRIFKSIESGKTIQSISGTTDSLNKMFASGNIQGVFKDLRSIMQKIDNGTGTLGALVNDPALYENARSLVGGANRNRIIRNLVRQTVKDGAETEDRSPEMPKK
jgi:phospholipid/cholesterol/gamma-HCH transport system substrate-binding protein